MEEEEEVEKEVESSYKPTVGLKRNIPVVSPHRPTTQLPSSLSHPHVKGGSTTVPYTPSFSTSTTAADDNDFDGKAVGGDQMREKEKESEVDIGFVPSFLESGRQPRQRR